MNITDIVDVLTQYYTYITKKANEHIYHVYFVALEMCDLICTNQAKNDRRKKKKARQGVIT